LRLNLQRTLDKRSVGRRTRGGSGDDKKVITFPRMTATSVTPLMTH